MRIPAPWSLAIFSRLASQINKLRRRYRTENSRSVPLALQLGHDFFHNIQDTLLGDANSQKKFFSEKVTAILVDVEAGLSHPFKKTLLGIEANMVVLPKALPSFSLIDNCRIFVNFTDTQNNRHHQNPFTSGFENAVQLAEGLSVVRNVLQNV